MLVEDWEPGAEDKNIHVDGRGPGGCRSGGGPLLCDLREHCCFVLLCSVGIR